MNHRIKTFSALSIFLGLILFIELNRDENKVNLPQPETTVDVEFETTTNYAVTNDTNAILKTFFPDGEIIEKNKIKWKPDLEEKLSMAVSEDGNCYTILDTIIQIDDYEQELYVFHTVSWMKDLKTMNLHYNPDKSFALVEKNGNQIKTIKKFVKKSIHFDHPVVWKNMELIKVGPEKSALKLVVENDNSYIKSEETALVDIDELNPLLCYESLQTNEFVIEDRFGINEGLIKKEVEMDTQTGLGGFYDIILSHKETVFDSTTERLITKYTTKVYRWNGKNGLELCYD